MYFVGDASLSTVAEYYLGIYQAYADHYPNTQCYNYLDGGLITEDNDFVQSLDSMSTHVPCMVLKTSDKKWYNANCTAARNFICKKAPKGLL